MPPAQAHLSLLASCSTSDALKFCTSKHGGYAGGARSGRRQQVDQGQPVHVDMSALPRERTARAQPALRLHAALPTLRLPLAACSIARTASCPANSSAALAMARNASLLRRFTSLSISTMRFTSELGSPRGGPLLPAAAPAPSSAKPSSAPPPPGLCCCCSACSAADAAAASSAQPDRRKEDFSERPASEADSCRQVQQSAPTLQNDSRIPNPGARLAAWPRGPCTPASPPRSAPPSAAQ